MKVSRAAVATVAACLTVGLAGAPSAMADDSAKAKSAARTPSTKTINKRLNTARKQLSTTRKRVNTARRNITKITTDLGAVSKRLASGEGSIGLLLGAAPQLINAVTKLGTEVPPALVALKEAVTVTIPGAIRSTVTDLQTSVEYGVAAVYTSAPGKSVDEACCRTTTVVSSDIPDTGNTASASGTLPIQVTPTAAAPPADPSTYPNAVNPGTKLSLRAAIKSGENDGGATGDPAGQVGGLMTVTCGGGGGNPAFCGDDGNPGAGQADIPAGTVICVVGPTQSNTYKLPNGTTTTQSLINIQEKSGLTDSTVPAFNFGPKLVNVLANAQNAAGSGNKADGTCTLPNAFGLYQVQVQTQFADIPTSATPGLKD